MMNQFHIEKLQSIFDDSRTKAQSLWEPFWRKLTCNLANGILSPLKVFSVCLEKGGLAVVYGSVSCQK